MRGYPGWRSPSAWAPLALACLVAMAVPAAGVGTAEAPDGSPPAEPGFLGFKFEMEDQGARVVEVIEGTAAERSSLRVGDLVLSLGGESLAGLSHRDMHDIVAPLAVGQRVTLEVVRGDVTSSVTLTLGPIPPEYRVSEEERGRFHAALWEHEGLEQFFGLVRRSSVLRLRRAEAQAYLIRPETRGAEWEPLHPFLVQFLDRHLGGAVSGLAEGRVLRFSATAKASGVRLKVLEVLPASQGSS